MKKIIAALLVVIAVFSLCACGSETSDPGIELTLDNWSTYLEATGGTYFANRTDALNGYETAICEATVTGASGNYNYEDVVVTLCLTATSYDLEGKVSLSESKYLDIPCNVAGNGSLNVSYTIKSWGGKYAETHINDYNNTWRDYTVSSLGFGEVFSLSVSSVSGRVVPVK